MIWIAGAALVAAVLLMVFLPLFGRGTPSVLRAVQARKSEVADQLAALAQLRKDGEIGEEEYLAQHKSLETDALALLEEEKKLKALPENDSADRKRLRVAVAAFLLLLTANVAAGVYLYKGGWMHAGPQSAAGHGEGGQAPVMGADGQPDPAKMVARLEERLRENPDDPRGQAMLGRSYMVMERFDDAVKAYKKALELDPSNMDARVGLGVSTLRLNQVENATKIFDGILKDDPVNPDALWFTGMLQIHRGEIEGAKATWAKLLEVTPPEYKEQMTQQIEEVIRALAQPEKLPKAQ